MIQTNLSKLELEIYNTNIVFISLLFQPPALLCHTLPLNVLPPLPFSPCPPASPWQIASQTTTFTMPSKETLFAFRLTHAKIHSHTRSQLTVPRPLDLSVHYEDAPFPI